jgi:putative addiction module antidote
MITIRVRQVGNSLGFTLPAQAVHLLRISEGDTLFLTEAPGGFRMTPYSPEFEGTVAAAEIFMKRYQNALRMPSK